MISDCCATDKEVAWCGQHVLCWHRATRYSWEGLIDHGDRFDLSLQTYEWLKHASEDSYHYWYYNEDGGFTGNEQDFYDAERRSFLALVATAATRERINSMLDAGAPVRN